MLSKTACINLAFLLGACAVVFRLYLPLTDEIQGLNADLRAASANLSHIQRTIQHMIHPEKAPQPLELYALPDAQRAFLGRELEALAHRHHATLQQIAADDAHPSVIPGYHLTLTPYKLDFKTAAPDDFTALMADLEKWFPELKIRQFTYRQEVGSLDAWLVSSSQQVRLFTP